MPGKEKPENAFSSVVRLFFSGHYTNIFPAGNFWLPFSSLVCPRGKSRLPRLESPHSRLYNPLTAGVVIDVAPQAHAGLDGQFPGRTGLPATDCVEIRGTKRGYVGPAP